jgi:hypothetical protein
MGTSYRVVSEVRGNGQWVDIPDAARNVTVEPVSKNGQVRVTYLKPMEEVALGESETEQPAHSYVE